MNVASKVHRISHSPQYLAIHKMGGTATELQHIIPLGRVSSFIGYSILHVIDGVSTGRFNGGQIYHHVMPRNCDSSCISIQLKSCIEVSPWSLALESLPEDFNSYIFIRLVYKCSPKSRIEDLCYFRISMNCARS